jgi:hypothetical protein
MSHDIHSDHGHKHGKGCGHTSVTHDDHTDYIHEGHLHSAHGDHYDEHRIAVGTKNPDECRPTKCDHKGTADSIPHGNHTDLVHDSHLHRRHGDHCDDHGKIVTAQ